MEKCSNCAGTGRILIGTSADCDYAKCPVCNGKGYVGTKEDE